MLRWYDCRTSERAAGLAAAAAAVRRGELVVLPTDTVYGLAADASHPAAVGRLLRAKGRGRSMPSPVLIGSPAAVTCVTAGLPPRGSGGRVLAGWSDPGCPAGAVAAVGSGRDRWHGGGADAGPSGRPSNCSPRPARWPCRVPIAPARRHRRPVRRPSRCSAPRSRSIWTQDRSRPRWRPRSWM